MRPTQKRRRSRKGTALLTVTSLVDILSILLIFLLMSFSPEGALLHAAQDLELPETTSKEGIFETDRVVAVSSGGISVGENMVTDLGDWKGELLIPGLARALGDVTGSDEAQRRVLIEGDRRIPFDLLYAVLFTSHQAGYRKLALAAYEEEGDRGGEGR